MRNQGYQPETKIDNPRPPKGGTSESRFDFQKEVSNILSQIGRKKPDDMTMGEKIEEMTRMTLELNRLGGKMCEYALPLSYPGSAGVIEDMADILTVLARLAEVYNFDLDRLQRIAIQHLSDEHGIEVRL